MGRSSKILLCAGCRVGMCFKEDQTQGGCLEFDEAMEGKDFVFYCLFCCRKLKRRFDVGVFAINIHQLTPWSRTVYPVGRRHP